MDMGTVDTEEVMGKNKLLTRCRLKYLFCVYVFPGMVDTVMDTIMVNKKMFFKGI